MLMGGGIQIADLDGFLGSGNFHCFKAGILVSMGIVRNFADLAGFTACICYDGIVAKLIVDMGFFRCFAHQTGDFLCLYQIGFVAGFIVAVCLLRQGADTRCAVTVIGMGVLLNTAGGIACQCQARLAQCPEHMQGNREGEYQNHCGHACFPYADPFQYLQTSA